MKDCSTCAWFRSRTADGRVNCRIFRIWKGQITQWDSLRIRGNTECPDWTEKRKKRGRR